LSIIIAIELLCASQGVEFRAPLVTSVKLRKILSIIRKNVKKLINDRYLSEDIKNISTLVEKGVILSSANLGSYVIGEI